MVDNTNGRRPPSQSLPQRLTSIHKKKEKQPLQEALVVATAGATSNTNTTTTRTPSSFQLVARSVSRHHSSHSVPTNTNNKQQQQHHRPTTLSSQLTVLVSVVCCFCLATLYTTHQHSYQRALRDQHGLDDLYEQDQNRPRVARTTTTRTRHKQMNVDVGDGTTSHHAPLSFVDEDNTYPSSVHQQVLLPRQLALHKRNEDAVETQVCPDCYSRVIASSKITCGVKIVKYYQSTMKTMKAGLRNNNNNNNNTSSFSHHHDEARRAVARDYPAECGVCDPSACADHQRIFRRPDRMGPLIRAATTHYLTSIGEANRVPGNLVNRTEYFSHPANVYPQRRYLFEYNPSIIVLPDDQRVDIDGETAYYLASYRVSNLQQCIIGDDEYWMLGDIETKQRPRQHDYLALALLRRDLSIIHDVVLELRKVVVGARMEDFRLFVFPPNNQIVVTSFDFIVPIWLHNNNNNNNNTSPPSPGDNREGTIVEVPQYAPSPLRVYTRMSAAACTPFIKSGSAYNKNLNYFVGDDGNLMVEYKPMSPKYRMPLSSSDDSSSSPIAPCVRGSSQELPVNSDIPVRSFDTVDILHFWNQSLFEPYSNERGSACCVSIDHPNRATTTNEQTKLLVGISHSKTPYARNGNKPKSGDVPSNMFFTSLYAMEAVYPYKVVAVSGRFCLGHATEAEVLRGNPFARSNLTPLRIDREYDCPRINFVSGLSEVVDDPTSVIIGYGINDCVPRFVQVKKADLMELLFFGNNESNNNNTTTTSSSIISQQ